MSRWDTLPSIGSSPQNQQNYINYPQNSPILNNNNNNNFGMSSQQSGIAGTNPNEVYQHGTLGKFLRSEMEGTQSGFMKCIYEAKDTANQTVTKLCEKRENCCVHGCCPKDQYWMAGVYILLAFVIFVFVTGTCIMFVCYQRSKIKQRKEERDAYEYANYAGSQVGVPPATGAYSSYGGPNY